MLKIPMIICGPGDAKLAHQPNEHVEVSKLVQAAKIYTLAAAKLLQ
jgi:succinyl-diaminopimelate desuccinylase